MKKLLYFIVIAIILLSSCNKGYPEGVTYEGDAVESLSPGTKAILETIKLQENGSLVVHVDSICPKNDYLDKIDAPNKGMAIYAYLEPKIIKAEVYGAAGGDLVGVRGKEYLAEQTAYSNGVPVEEALVSMARLLEDVNKEAEQKYTGWFQSVGVVGARDFVNNIIYNLAFIIKPYDNFWGTLVSPLYKFCIMCATWSGSIVGGLSLMTFLFSVFWLLMYMCLIWAIKKGKNWLRTIFLALINILMFLALLPILVYTICFAVPNHEIIVALQDIYGYTNTAVLADVYAAHSFAPSTIGMAVFVLLTFFIFKLLCWSSIPKSSDKSEDEQASEFGNSLGEKIGDMLPLLIGAFVLDKILLWAFALYYIFRIVCKVFDLVILHSKPFATFLFKHTIGIMLALIVVGVAGFFCFGIGGEVVSGDPLAAREQAFAQKVYSQGQIDSMSYMVGMDVGNCAKVVFADGFKQIDPIITQRAMSQKIRYGNGYEVSFNSTADSLSWELGLLYGTLLRSNHCITGMGEFNLDRFKQGYDDAIRSDGKLWFIPVDGMMDNWKDLRQQYVAKQNLQEGKAFLEKNATREGVNVSKSGLQYVIDDPGEGRRLRSSSTVNVKYKGMTLDGHVFDAHDNMQFKLNKLIKGWTEGLCMLSEGGKIVMFIPSELAYGDRSINGIEPNSVTIYEVEVLKVVRR